MQSFDRSLNSHCSVKRRERWECWEGVRSLQPSTLGLQVGWLVTCPYTVSGVPQRDCFSLSFSRVMLKAQRQSYWLCLKTMLMPKSFTQLSFASCKGSWEPEWGRCGPQSWEHRHFTGGAALWPLCMTTGSVRLFVHHINRLCPNHFSSRMNKQRGKCFKVNSKKWNAEGILQGEFSFWVGFPILTCQSTCRRLNVST